MSRTTIETWKERVARMTRNHRDYLTVWEAGDPQSDRLAAAHERDIAFAARCLEISFTEMVARLDRYFL